MSFLIANVFPCSRYCRGERWKWEVVDPNGKRAKIRVRMYTFIVTARSSKLNSSRAAFNPELYRETETASRGRYIAIYLHLRSQVKSETIFFLFIKSDEDAKLAIIFFLSLRY